MSLNLQAAFDLVISLKGKDMTLDDLENNIQLTVKVATSNFFRNFAAPGDMTIPGRSFIISNNKLEGSTIPKLKEGMRLIEASGREHTISEIDDMDGLYGEVLGFRVVVE